MSRKTPYLSRTHDRHFSDTTPSKKRKKGKRKKSYFSGNLPGKKGCLRWKFFPGKRPSGEERWRKAKLLQSLAGCPSAPQLHRRASRGLHLRNVRAARECSAVLSSSAVRLRWRANAVRGKIEIDPLQATSGQQSLAFRHQCVRNHNSALVRRKERERASSIPLMSAPSLVAPSAATLHSASPSSASSASSASSVPLPAATSIASFPR